MTNQIETDTDMRGDTGQYLVQFSRQTNLTFGGKLGVNQAVLYKALPTYLHQQPTVLLGSSQSLPDCGLQSACLESRPVTGNICTTQHQSDSSQIKTLSPLSDQWSLLETGVTR